jgi:hypothetical protein
MIETIGPGSELPGAALGFPAPWQTLTAPSAHHSAAHRPLLLIWIKVFHLSGINTVLSTAAPQGGE